MRQFASALLGAVFLLSSLPTALAAQENGTSERVLRLVSAQPGDDVWFRIVVDQSAASTGSTGHLLSSPAVEKVQEQTWIQTPAQVLLATDQPFEITFATRNPQEELELVVDPSVLRQVRVAGDRVVIGRSEAGGGINVLAATRILQRALTPPVVEP